MKTKFAAKLLLFLQIRKKKIILFVYVKNYYYLCTEFLSPMGMIHQNRWRKGSCSPGAVNICRFIRESKVERRETKEK